MGAAEPQSVLWCIFTGNPRCPIKAIVPNLTKTKTQIKAWWLKAAAEVVQTMAANEEVHSRHVRLSFNPMQFTFY